MRTRSAKQVAAIPAVDPNAKSVKKTFVDDGDDDEVVQEESISPQVDLPQEVEESSNEDDEAPVEEVSNKASKQKMTEDAKKEKADQKASEDKRKKADQDRLEKKREEAEKAAAKKEARKAFRTAKLEAKAAFAEPSDENGINAEMVDVEEDDLDADLEEGDDQATAGPSRLDPSLFAEVFSKKATKAKSILKKREMTAEEAEEEARRKRQHKAQRRGGIVKGRDGMPMKRLADGTIVRSLASHSSSAAGKKKTTFDDDDEEDAEEKGPLDPVVRPTALDPTVSLPSAKVRGFKKRKLGMTQSADGWPQQKTKEQAKKIATISKEDDPLGLNDPAFLPGGQFYKGSGKRQRLTGGTGRKDPKNTGAGTPGELAKQGFRGAGGRRDALSAFSSRQTGGPSLGFARSLA